MHWSHEFDVVALGSGAAGMCAALVAQCEGLQALVVEKSGVFGGTTALSGGGIWVPLAKPSGNEDSRERVLTYLGHTVGPNADRHLIEAFVDNGQSAIQYLEQHTSLQFSGRRYSPDYCPDVEGAALGGRAIDPLEFDGRALASQFAALRRPLPEFLVFGGMMVHKGDIQHLLKSFRSATSFVHVARLLLRLGRDRIQYPRGTRLVLGNALAARLLKSCIDRGVTLWRKTGAVELVQRDGRIQGAVLECDGKRLAVRGRLGVIAATGGFPANLDMRRALLPPPAGLWSAGSEDNVGDGLKLGLAAGGTLAAGNRNNAFWAPVSTMLRQDGSMARFPHVMMDRYMPGIIAVSQSGKRFVNEADSYHVFCEAMFRTGSIPAFLLADARALYRYGLGMVRPQAASLSRFLDSGYLLASETIAGLAHKLGVARGQIESTVERFNGDAARGVDTEFGKGGNAYNRNMGDGGHAPNPCLAPLTRAPYYAVKVWPGDVGTSCGLVTDARARVLDAQRQPILGLYAGGNDMNSIMGGSYPAPGVSLGPTLVFAYLAARDMKAGQAARPVASYPPAVPAR